MIDGFNTPLAVDILANIEDVKYTGGHSQNFWGKADADSSFARTLEEIKDDKGAFVGYGSCDSAMCYAGWGLTLSGIKMIWEAVEDTTYLVASHTESYGEIHEKAADLLGFPDMDDCVSQICVTRGHCEHLPEDRYNPYWDYAEGYPLLFGVENSLADLYEMTAEYAGITVSELKDRVEKRREEYLLKEFSKQEIKVYETVQ